MPPLQAGCSTRSTLEMHQSFSCKLLSLKQLLVRRKPTATVWGLPCISSSSLLFLTVACSFLGVCWYFLPYSPLGTRPRATSLRFACESSCVRLVIVVQPLLGGIFLSGVFTHKMYVSIHNQELLALENVMDEIWIRLMHGEHFIPRDADADDGKSPSVPIKTAAPTNHPENVDE
jgi:hypothetical protein